MISADDIIEALENQQVTISNQNEIIRLFAVYLIIAADKGALDHECHAVIEAKNVLKLSSDSDTTTARAGEGGVG